jgi:hypothetical protein
VNLSAFIPSCCICWKNCVIAFSCCSSFIYLMQKCSIAWCLVPLEPSQVSSIPKPEWFPCLRFCARAEESKFKVLQGVDQWLSSDCWPFDLHWQNESWRRYFTYTESSNPELCSSSKMCL